MARGKWLLNIFMEGVMREVYGRPERRGAKVIGIRKSYVGG